jgi:hypothetical protein
MPAPARKPATVKTAAPVKGKPEVKPEHKILFQSYVKSLNPLRTYVGQIKEAGNKNQYLVLTEGKRDPETDEVKKIRLFIYSEDFPAFFRMLHETAQWIKANPISEDVKSRRTRYWAKQSADGKNKSDTSPNGRKSRS